MFNHVRRRILRFARVPAEPEAPIGAPGSIRIFRAGRNYYKLRLLRWGITQIGAAIGIVISLSFISYLETTVNTNKAAAQKARTEQAAPAVNVAPTPPAPLLAVPAGEKKSPAEIKRAKNLERASNLNRKRGLVRVAERWPDWVFPLIHLVEYGAIAFFIIQLPVTYAAVRLEFEQHWYIVTDRSLRIRTGLFALTESTMSFANVQHVELKQGPLQRLLGLADVRVQSAGGGENSHSELGDSLHTGIFHGVENAREIRDLILERLRRFRAAGLGDPDDQHHTPPLSPPLLQGNTALAAAQELLAEAKALRQVLK